MSEDILQMTVVQMIRVLYPSLLINLSMSGVPLQGSAKTNAQVISKMKKLGLVKGIPDLLVYLPEGKVLNLEFKRPDGKGVQSDDQAAVQQQLTNLGHNYYLVSSVDQVFAAITEHTDPAFRALAFRSLLLPDRDKVSTKPFLHWPAGTELGIIIDEMKQLYHI